MATNATHGRERTEGDLNDVFDALAHPHRRAVIDALDETSPATLEELAATVAGREDAVSESDAAVALHHSHLPKLDDDGVIRYDVEDRVCELARIDAERAVLSTARDHL